MPMTQHPSLRYGHIRIELFDAVNQLAEVGRQQIWRDDGTGPIDPNVVDTFDEAVNFFGDVGLWGPRGPCADERVGDSLLDGDEASAINALLVALDEALTTAKHRGKRGNVDSILDSDAWVTVVERAKSARAVLLRKGL